MWIKKLAAPAAGVCLSVVAATAPAADMRISTPDELGQRVELSDQVWALDGSMLVIKATLRVTGNDALKDFVIECLAVAPSGTVIGKPSTTLYEKLEPGARKTFNSIRIGLVNSQTDRAGCKVISASKVN